jgi:hypothetical protein
LLIPKRMFRFAQIEIDGIKSHRSPNQAICRTSPNGVNWMDDHIGHWMTIVRQPVTWTGHIR